MAKHSVAGIAFENGKFFIGKRIDKGQMANRWEFPGGKAEEGETDEVSLAREFEEEFGIQIKVGKQIASAVFKHGEEERELYAYLIYFTQPENGYVLTEHTDTDWATFDQIQKLNFVDSDLLLLPQLKEYFKL
ncbi:MAG: NUDIX domain-containing protein [Treponemataceae bacterium]|nr:NUDIX domain-containing protein [Treponemataceae bacterium]